MKTPPDREQVAPETPFRAPEHLAMAMPLVAVLGLVVVVSAVAFGASGPVVALVAVGGFGLCALAPMALMGAFVIRPLRAALAQLRAARDGHGVRGPDFASGVLADLVHIARDLHAAQANLGPGARTPLQDIAEDSARALRHQAESLAKAAAEGEAQITCAAQACFADLAEALKSLRDAPVAAGFDSAVERLESMLVYIAETQERAEAKDRQFEGAFSRAEVGMADLARLVARETETVQGALSNHGLLLRNDLADGLAQEKGGRARVLERIDTLENRLTKNADGVAAQVAGLAQAIRPPPARDGRLDDIAAAVLRLEGGIAQALARPSAHEGLGEDLRGLGAVVARLAEDLAGRDPGEAALREVSEALAAGLRAEVRETAAAVAAQVETLRPPAGLDREDLGAALADATADLSRQLADIGARLDASARDDEARELDEAARGLIETTARLEAQGAVPAELAGIVARLDAMSETDAQRFDALGARVEDRLLALGREQAQATQAAAREIGEAMARTPEALEQLGAEWRAVSQAVEALDGRLESKAPDVFALASDELSALARRLDDALTRQAAQGEDARRLAETVESALVEVAARTETAARRHGERLDDFAEETIRPAGDALAAAARDFAAAAADFAAVRARFEAGEPALVRVIEATQGARARLDALAESLPRMVAETAEAHGERLAARLDASTLAPARDALAQAREAFAQAREAFALSGETFEAAQGRLADAVVRLEAGDPRLASVAGKTEAIRSQIEALALAMRSQPDALAARLDAAALSPAREALSLAADRFDASQQRLAVAVEKIEAGDPRLADALAARLDAATLSPARDALAEATQNFTAAQARMAEAVGRIEAGDARLASLVGATGTLPGRIGDLAEALRAQGDNLAARLDAAALTPARDAFTLATQNFVAAQARLTQAAAKVEAGDPRVAFVAEAAKALRVEFAALAQNLPDALSACVGAGDLAPARDALGDAARAFDAARSRLDEGAESLARLRGDFVASEARFARMLEEAVTRMAALGFERLPDLLGDLAATQAQWRARLGEFDRSAAALATAASTDAGEFAALRDAVAGLAPGLEAAALAQGERIVQALAARDGDGAHELSQAIAELADLHAGLAQAHAPDTLRADLAASAQTLASRFDAAAQTLARQIEEQGESLRRGELAPAARALQASTQEMGKAHAELFGQVDALKASLAGDRSAFAALREDVVQAAANAATVAERADCGMRAAAERAAALSERVSELAGAERAELVAVAQALARIGERVEYAARAFEDRRGGDLATLGADLTRDIDALARATAERVLALEGGVETLAHAAGATLSQLREATRAFSGVGLERIVSRLDPLAELPALTRDLHTILTKTPAGEGWRPALDALGTRLAATLEAVERRLQAQFSPAPVNLAPSGSGAVANLVVSMAEALDARFAQIEAGLADLGARLLSGDPAPLALDLAALASELTSASSALKSGLADFVGVSAALVEGAGARAANVETPTAASASNSG